MEYIIIYIQLDLQQHWPLQFRALIILVLHLLSETIQHISSQLSQISE